MEALGVGREAAAGSEGSVRPTRAKMFKRYEAVGLVHMGRHAQCVRIRHHLVALVPNILDAGATDVFPVTQAINRI